MNMCYIGKLVDMGTFCPGENNWLNSYGEPHHTILVNMINDKTTQKKLRNSSNENQVCF